MSLQLRLKGLNFRMRVLHIAVVVVLGVVVLVVVAIAGIAGVCVTTIPVPSPFRGRACG